MKKVDVFPPGSLAVVATPIGNMGDLSDRAREILATADLIAAEDTRDAKRLLDRIGLSKQLASYHEWNEKRRAESLVGLMHAGKRIALISDAGTPAVSDPGFELMRAARREGLKVIPVPGPSALITFLSVAGLPTDRFSFLGFPPSKKKARTDLFVSLVERPETLVFYESPKRIIETLSDALEAFGDRQGALGREMTKLHEEFLYGSINEMRNKLASRPKVLGEICWGVTGRGKQKAPAEGDEFDDALSTAAASGEAPKKLAKELAERFDLTAKKAYSVLLARKSD